MRERHKPFPPGRGDLLVPVGSRRGTRAALALYPACLPRAALAQRLAWMVARVGGARLLPGRGRTWDPPVPAAEWGEVEHAWREALGPWDETAVLRQVEPGRQGFALLLLRQGDPLAFVKLRPEPGPLARERAALAAVAAFGPAAFSAPGFLAEGRCGAWSWLAMTPLPPRIHHAATAADVEPVLAELGGALADLPRAPDVPPHWRPMHGDLTPWNLRRMPRAGVALVDWEEAGWGPPGADRVLFEATVAALGGEPPSRGHAAEAVAFWRRALHGRGRDPRNRRLALGIDRALASMAGLDGASLAVTEA